MADLEHEKILEQGVKAWNAWRNDSGGITPDLAHKDLSGERLVDFNFTSADLRGTKVVDVDFSLCNFNNANLSGLIFQGAILRQTQFNGADLSESDLSSAVLDQTNFSQTVLLGANISGATASGLRFERADLTGANLRSSNFTNCNFTAADLSGANLSSADFSGSNLIGINLDGSIINAETKGFENLSEREKARLIFREEDGSENEKGGAWKEGVWAGPKEDAGMSSETPQITVGGARPILEGVHAVLVALPNPNDWGHADRAHGDLFTALLSTIEGLNQSFAKLTDENRRLSDENEELRNKIDVAKPLLRQAWETFVIDAAKVTSKGPAFVVGFTAGMGAQAAYTAITGQPFTIDV